MTNDVAKGVKNITYNDIHKEFAIRSFLFLIGKKKCDFQCYYIMDDAVYMYMKAKFIDITSSLHRQYSVVDGPVISSKGITLINSLIDAIFDVTQPQKLFTVFSLLYYSVYQYKCMDTDIYPDRDEEVLHISEFLHHIYITSLYSLRYIVNDEIYQSKITMINYAFSYFFRTRKEKLTSIMDISGKLIFIKESYKDTVLKHISIDRKHIMNMFLKYVIIKQTCLVECKEELLSFMILTHNII